VTTGFEEWARSQTPALLRAAFLLTSQQQDAEDLVQEALARTYTAWKRIDGYPEAYTRQILYRLQVSRWRRRRPREISVQALPDLPDLPDDRRTDSPDLRLVLMQALRELAPAQRAVVVLRYFEDMTEMQAAATLGCSVGTVKSHHFRALENLRRKAPELADLLNERTASDV
jgi:RNA polymerase sigma-70 factor (sigma-E family)